MKPFAESSEQNKLPILEVLQQWFIRPGTVLEIGSGTGQHAVFFSGQFPHLLWQPSDRAENLAGIRLWWQECAHANLCEVIELDVTQGWPAMEFDYVFSANTAHIMSWPEVEKMFAGVGQVLKAGGVFCLYGPFNYGGNYTSDSNARFDAWLKERDPRSGIRDFEALQELGEKFRLRQVGDHAMPANNRILAWQRLPD